jgi:hypothetical protein
VLRRCGGYDTGRHRDAIAASLDRHAGMRISRRDFIHTGCTAAAASLVSEPSFARLRHGSATSSVGGSQSRLNINVPSDGQLYLNLFKNTSNALAPGSANQTSDGYPANGILGSNVNFSGINPPPNYYGKLFWGWTNTGSMEINSNLPWIVYSGGLSVYPNAGAAQDGNSQIIIAPNSGTAGITSPAVVFNYGWNIQSITNSGISNGSGGNLALITVKSGFFSGSGLGGTTINVTGTGTSQDNITTTITARTGDTFTLDGSTYVAGSGVAGTAVFVASNLTFSFFGGQTFNNMSNAILCRYTNGTTDDYHDITVNGYIFDTVLVNQLKYLMNSAGRGTPGWLRFMDLLSGGRCFNGDYANRMPATALSYQAAGRFVNNYWAGSVANSSDAFSCSDPALSVWSGSAYIDGAVVQGIIASTNTTGIPTLAVGGHPAAPIYYNSSGLKPLIFGLPTAPSAAGQSLQWTFNVGGASYLNSGANYTFTYTTVSGDVGNLTGFQVNVVNAMAAALNAHTTNNQIQFNLSTSTSEIYVYAPTPLTNGTTGGAANVMVVTYSGATTCNLYRLPASAMTGNCTFIYNALLQGWCFALGGITSNIPLEAVVDLCNRVGAHCYFNWDITTSAYVTSTTTFFANNLNSGLKFGTETGNEVWNSGAFPYFQYLTLGGCLGWSISVGGQANLSYTGLRTVQFAAISRAAWAAAGKPAANHLVFSQSQVSDYTTGNNTNIAQFAGTNLRASLFPLYASYGGLGATATADHFAAGTRPIDASDAIGNAPYWATPWWSGSAQNQNGPIVGTVAQNSPWLQASLDFTNGSTATAFASLVSQFDGVTPRSDATIGTPFAGTVFAFFNYQTTFTGFEAIAFSYDTYRMSGSNTLAANNSGAAAKLGIFHYEGGPQWAMGADAINGLNSVNSTDINALAAQMTFLGWNVNAYDALGGTGSTAITHVATQVITMAQAFKYDASYKNMIKTWYYQAFYNTSGINREVHPAQYGYNSSQWGLFPGTYSAGNQYTNYDAIHEWNA